MKILLDTNFIITSLKFKIDIFSEIRRIAYFNYEIFVLDKTIDELKKLKNKLALQIIDKYNVKITKTSENLDADALLILYADSETIVATQDRELRKALKKKNIRILSIRQKNYYIII
ncbi:hypothetical protein J4471_03535 [Candidatus Woesearchaeota archaeon]|nr:hypothetical protein [Candidatus Woesearchaeota archaeon]